MNFVRGSIIVLLLSMINLLVVFASLNPLYAPLAICGVFLCAIVALCAIKP